MRYRLEFTDTEQGEYRVDIFNTDTGDWKELCGSGNPLTIRSTKGELIEPILGTGVEIGIIVKDYKTITQAEYEEIFTAPPQTYKVEVYKDLNLIFTGYVDTELYQETFVYPPYEILLTASDGLKSLKNYEPVFEPYEKLNDVIKKCLLKTGLDLKIWNLNTLCSENIVLKTDNDLGQMSSIFEKSQISLSAFSKKDAKNILEGVLKSFNCKIYQKNGEWHIDRLGDLYYKGYSLDDICISETKVPKTRDLTPFFLEDKFIGRGQSLEVNAPYGKQTIVGTDNKTDNLLPPIKDVNKIDRVIDNTDTLNIGKWYYSNEPTATQGIYSVAEDSINFKSKVLRLIPPVAPVGGMDMLIDNGTFGIRKHISVPLFKKGYESDEIVISYKIKINWNDKNYVLNTYNNLEMIVPIFVSLGDSNSKWIITDYDSNQLFTNFKGIKIGKKPVRDNLNIGSMDNQFIYKKISLNSINIDNVLEGSITIKQSNIESNEFEDVKLNEDLNESINISLGFGIVCFSADFSSGKNYFTMPGQNMKYYDIGDIGLNVKEVSKYNNTYTGILEQNYLREADKLEIDLWNPVRSGTGEEIRGIVSSTSRWVNLNKASNIYNATGEYSDTVKLDEYSGLGLWYTLKQLENNSYISNDLGHRLPVVLLNSWFNMFSTNQDIINATIKSKNLLNFDKTYNIEGRPNKQFMMITRNYNCKNCQLKATFHELKDEEITTNV